MVGAKWCRVLATRRPTSRHRLLLKNFVQRQVPAAPKDYVPRGSPAPRFTLTCADFHPMHTVDFTHGFESSPMGRLQRHHQTDACSRAAVFLQYSQSATFTSAPNSSAYASLRKASLSCFNAILRRKSASAASRAARASLPDAPLRAPERISFFKALISSRDIPGLLSPPALRTL